MRLALIRLSALGDIVHTWPLAVALKMGLPGLHLTWVVEEPLRQLVDGHPAVDGVITVSTRRWRRSPFSAGTRSETGAVRRRLRALHADIALDPQGTLKSAWIARMTGATETLGLKRPWRRELLAGFAYTRTLAGSSTDSHVIATNMELATALGAPRPDSPTMPNGSWLLERCRSQAPHSGPDGDYAVILPGAGDPTKVVAAETLAEVVLGLADRGLRSTVAWGPGERERAEAVAARAHGSATLAPPTDIAQLTRLLGAAKLVIGGDTGPVHLAASLGVPSLGLFLTTDWRRNGPRGPSTAVVSGAILPPRVVPNSARARRGRAPEANEIVTAAWRLASATGAAAGSTGAPLE